MTLRSRLRVPRTRRAFAACLMALAAGGLILHRAPASARTNVIAASPSSHGNGETFAGRGAHGSIALSQTHVPAGQSTRVSVVLRLAADPKVDADQKRAPLALAVVLDTSGSMQGEKLDQAKNAVLELIRELADDDEITLIRYASDSEVVLPLSRVGSVRASLRERVGDLVASGGTNIPPALSRGLSSLGTALGSRVKRVVLVSDGLDQGRIEAERIARDGIEDRITVSSLGIGLDFDASYMGGLAEAGRGNFAFVENAASLGKFLRRELEQTATTTIESTEATLILPEGVRFVRAIGAEGRPSLDGQEVSLRLGALFAGDERRIVVELMANAEAGQSLAIQGNVVWSNLGGARTRVSLTQLSIVGTSDMREASLSIDGEAHAEATSALASSRQLEAAQAMERGDLGQAAIIINENVTALRAAQAVAPSPAATALAAQSEAYEKARDDLAKAPPKSPGAKAAARKMADKEISNMGRDVAF